MIRNLNQVSFQRYGAVLPDRAGKCENADGSHCLTLTIGRMQEPVYKAASETRICCFAGKAILSVSADGEEFSKFYLDRVVLLKKDVLFSLSPFIGDAQVQLISHKNFLQQGWRPGENHRVEGRLRISGLYTVFYQEREKGFLFSGEAHPMTELIYVDQGTLHSVVNGQDILLERGDLSVVGANQWHMLYADMDVAPRYVSITFDLEGIDPAPLLNRKIAVSQQVVGLLQQILREEEEPDAYSGDLVIGQLGVLLLTLLREQDCPRTGKLRNSNAVQNENEIIRRAQQYIGSHIREKLSVPKVARQVDVSPSYLTALFHKNLQIAPGEYIRRIKLQESKQMIRENNLNFTEIAAELQYSTVHHFSRQFKEKFGITPSEYAKSVR